ncbi:universal stress protein [Pseudonocardia sp. NPDC049154]|uniref:universal stress protein n=1 Tax=Pseudonocardia sp. NPDC049154 TaxID=3155501 RepID=UPI0033C370FA
MSLARGTGAVLYAVDVRDEHDDRAAGAGGRCDPPALQDAHRALAQASISADDVHIRLVVTPGDPDETLLRLADRPDDLLVLGHSRHPAQRAERPLALRCAARARCSVVIVPCEHPLSGLGSGPRRRSGGAGRHRAGLPARPAGAAAATSGGSPDGGLT